MKPENDPITDDEWILRRVHKVDFPTPSIPGVAPKAFRPRTKGDIDTDGISVYRASCVADPVEILAAVPSDKLHEQGIVRLSVTFLNTLGLTVVPAPEPPIPGHVVIPELNADAYTTDKKRILAIMEKLATEASKDENMVKRPDSPPADL